MTKIKFILIGLMLTLNMIVLGQEKQYPTYKPIVKVFGNYHFGLNDYSEDNGFEIKRAYLGYDVKMSDYFSFKTNIDVGNPKNGSSYELTAFLKTAELNFKKNNLKIKAGLIGLKQFKVQEKKWGYRYVYKSFQDEHKFGSSADFGAMLEYTLFNGFSLDATVRNGEGYKKLQSDNTYNGAVGFTYNFIESFTLRSSYEYSKKSIAQTVYSGFIGYEFNKKLLFGLEYNYMENVDYIQDHNLNGLSTYLTYVLNEKFQVFGRYDKLSSNTLKSEIDAWNISDNGEAIIGGLQYKLEKNIKVAANVQYWAPEQSGLNNLMYMYINLEYKL